MNSDCHHSLHFFALYFFAGFVQLIKKITIVCGMSPVSLEKKIKMIRIYHKHFLNLFRTDESIPTIRKEGSQYLCDGIQNISDCMLT